MTTEEREDRTMRGFVIAIALLLAVCVGLVIGAAFPDQVMPNRPKPDVTVANCSVWADTSSPVLPPHTMQDVCIDDLGTLHTAPDTVLTAPDTH